MPDPDHNLVKRCLRGDSHAFGLLYDRHAARIHRLLARLTGNATHAEDLTQETFVAAYAALASWRGEGALEYWLCGIAVRLYRRSLRRAHLLETPLLDDAYEVFLPDNDPLDALTRQEAERLLEQAIRELPEAYREAFVLLRVEGMKQREAAELLELPIGTVQSRLGREVSLPRRRLQENETDGRRQGTSTQEATKGGGTFHALQHRA